MKHVYAKSIRTDSELIGEEFENELFFCRKMSAVRNGSRSCYSVILTDKTGDISGMTSNSAYADLTGEPVLVHGLVSLSKDKPILQIYSMRKAPETERENGRTTANPLVCSVSQSWSVENMRYLDSVLKRLQEPYKQALDPIVRKNGVVVKMACVPSDGFAYNGGSLDGLCYILHLVDAMQPVELPANVYAAYPLDTDLIRSALILYHIGISTDEVSLPEKRDAKELLGKKGCHAGIYCSILDDKTLTEWKKKQLMHCIRVLDRIEDPFLQEAEILLHLLQMARIRGSYSHADYMGDRYVNDHPFLKEE